MPLKDTTTPGKAFQRPRRALGDISNKKTNHNGGVKDGGNSLVLKPRLSSKNSPNTPGRSNQHFPSRIPKLGGSKTGQKPDLAKRTHPWSTQIQHSSSSLTSPSPAISYSRPVDFILPTSTRSAQGETRSNVNVSTASKVAEQVEDVELPAGRLWVEQLQQAIDDEVSTGSLTDILESRTMWDDYKEVMKKDWDEERQKLAKADEAIMQARIDEMLREDEKGMY